MGVSRMQGTPWHEEVLGRKEGDPRRHRSRCIYFERDMAQCSHYRGKCWGSAHCMHYSEYDYNEEALIPKESNKETISDSDAECLFSEGNRVIHKKKFGPGIVKNIEDGHITVEFDSGKEIIFVQDICVKNRLLEKEE